MATRRSVSGQGPKQAPAKRKSTSARRTHTPFTARIMWRPGCTTDSA